MFRAENAKSAEKFKQRHSYAGLAPRSLRALREKLGFRRERAGGKSLSPALIFGGAQNGCYHLFVGHSGAECAQESAEAGAVGGTVQVLLVNGVQGQRLGFGGVQEFFGELVAGLAVE